MYGGGIKCNGLSNPVIKNNIIAANQGYGIFGSNEMNPTIRYNNVWHNDDGNYGPNVGDRTAIDGNISADPNFVNSDNYHILPISSCVDVGDPAFIPPEESCDIDGEKRLFGDYVDLGADEVVTNIADFNTDGIVDILDLNTLVAHWLTVGNPHTDLFDDDFIDLLDYVMFAQQWLWKAPWHQ